LLLGLGTFGIIYTDDYWNTKIKSRSDVDGKTLIPGDVPNSETPSVLMKGGRVISRGDPYR
jgi:hypothetical protein